ncbi:hypothetical protein [Burkholderia stabilis]|uniref:EF-hand domain-containing protein n=1 Tax=Burkholderia stabilis TaxID=95485 RepID=A0AAJ5T5Z9_9BURK|nr:hypothetical protein [Burkholderia stabilis]VBB13968.1 hypothetical protein BSTAB16_4154 [Burkholderia stabilis]HDR9584325.1 hypothetical protein [Burkholderia stabilis]HDR9652687.1 hypothetical protein [Burkholderia stabilis]HDR9659243.1 hypothetical protein [Burkholderia stabilis]HDR9682868.1 hypothetical protein [Burkholderia stabilis]
MKIVTYFGFTVAATVISMSGIGAAFAYDDLPKPPPPPEGWVQPPKQSEGTVTRDVENQVAQRFTAATGGNPDGLLSKQQAKAAGWGLVSDHFSDIDRAGTGYVRLDDVLRFMSERTPQRIMRMKNATKQNQQL